MAASSSSSSSSSSSTAAEPRLPRHDVFLSFSGTDTRKKFTSHLYSALSEKQIGAYIDQVSLKQGSEISSELLKAIEESKISIIIFSKNYASSSWCLDELVHILECKKEKGRNVLPIFIDIDPSHIRKQEGNYAAAFERHEERFEIEKVQKWRQALNYAAGLSGWDSRVKEEAQIVKEVVERVREVLDSIKSKRSGYIEGLVGIQDRLKKIESFLDSPTVRTIGIWGMGGIGKTKLAEAVFDRFCNDFDGSCFSPSVRENVIKKGLDTLKIEVFSELLGEKNFNIFKPSDVNDRLSRKRRILLVLDDVDTPMQLSHLVGEPDRFCPGSKIIVTSRHKLLVDAEYKVEVLDFDDACKLFYLKAFRCKSCRGGYEGISGRVVKYARGHPLALEVLGLNVFGLSESIRDWERQLGKLERIPNGDIQKVLIRSYEVLDDGEKGLFLDIACFFKGQRSDFVEGISLCKSITDLVNKSLITIEGGEIHMHYFIQVMGQDIVLRSTQELGKRSRLWIAKDVSFVLEKNKGTEAIEGIYLPWNKEVEVHLRPDVFREMRKLRLLKFYDALGTLLGKVKFVDGDLRYLPNSLRYLHWEHYPGNSLPTNFEPQYLVELHMPCSENLQSLPANIGKLHKLKKLDISKCKNLRSLPELPMFIESVNVEDCSSLEKVSTSRSTRTLGRLLDKYDRDSFTYQRKFSFLNCTKLDEDAINNIFTEFLYKAQRAKCELVVCYPTKEIPRWFNNQSNKGSSVTLPPTWYNPKTFLGFVVSVIFEKVDEDFDPIECELHLKTNCGESLEEVVFKYAAFNKFTNLCSVNMVVWYKYFDHSKANFEKDQEASLKFKSHHAGVKRCGVRMLYREIAVEDAVEKSDDCKTHLEEAVEESEDGKTHLEEAVEESEDGKTHLEEAVEESEDGRNPKIEPWITDDSDKPPPKRPRNL